MLETQLSRRHTPTFQIINSSEMYRENGGLLPCSPSEMVQTADVIVRHSYVVGWAVGLGHCAQQPMNPTTARNVVGRWAARCHPPAVCWTVNRQSGMLKDLAILSPRFRDHPHRLFERRVRPKKKKRNVVVLTRNIGCCQEFRAFCFWHRPTASSSAGTVFESVPGRDPASVRANSEEVRRKGFAKWPSLPPACEKEGCLPVLEDRVDHATIRHRRAQSRLRNGCCARNAR
ncbi:hypothetical protein B0T14DRAFT_316873 [Immersiella caudata]|uniref:Uncharacterized protein n=1 Tax=Immersiella caudata TaxID=314043 RepID=A0AA39U3I9_9PEZI|nr:hypothetical protein B0T14DRAFT_316873 [Immersiella caudata]